MSHFLCDTLHIICIYEKCDILHIMYKLYICTIHKLWNDLNQKGNYFRFFEQSLDRSNGSGRVMDAIFFISSGIITRQIQDTSPSAEIRVSNPFKRLLELKYCVSGMFLDARWLHQNYDVLINSLMFQSVVHVNKTIKKRHFWGSNRDCDDVIRRIGYNSFNFF